MWELLSSCTEDELTRKLRNQLGDQGSIEPFCAQIRTRRKQKGENLLHPYQDVCKLSA